MSTGPWNENTATQANLSPSPRLLRKLDPVYIQEVGSGLQSPAVVLSQQGSPAGGGVVPVGCVSVLQRGELLFPTHFKGNKVPGGKKGSSSPPPTYMPASCPARTAEGRPHFPNWESVPKFSDLVI